MSLTCNSLKFFWFDNFARIRVTIIDQLWSICEGGYDEEWRHSVAPIPADKLAEALHAIDDDLDFAQDGSFLPPSGELKPDSNYSEDDDIEDARDDAIYFEKEVKLVDHTACG